MTENENVAAQWHWRILGFYAEFKMYASIGCSEKDFNF